MTSFEVVEAGWDDRDWCAEDVVGALLAHQHLDQATHVRKAHLRSLAGDVERLRNGCGSARLLPLMAQIHAKIATDLTPAGSRRLLVRLVQQAVLARLAGGAAGGAVVNG